MIDKKSLVAFANNERDRFEASLRQFVDIPTVSADESRLPDIRRCAELAASTIRDFGGEADILETAGNPIIHGRFNSDSNLPTVTVYNHLDVQPASRETEPWTSDPFVFTKQGDRYLGRGTTDDKGPALTALFGIRAAREAGVKANMHLLWELEEEIGSPSFDGAMKKYGKQLATDSVLVSDTIWVSRQRPACPAGLRGLQGFELILETAATDQHSGVTGGAARNPIGELMKLVSEMYDATTGKVKIKGFYDDVEPPSKQELADFRASGFTVKAFKKDHGFRSVRTEDADDMMKRIWAMPTFEVHGLVGGYTGPGIKTIIPPRAEAKISCRLVPNQDPKKIMKLVRDFVKQRNPDVKVVPESSMLPYKAPTTGPLADAVRSSMKFAFGREPVFVREGGSIGAIVSMEKVLKVPVLFLGLSLPEHGYHAPNENYDWQQASGGMVAFAKYFDEIANL
ncbi:MAG: M20/M25/M40 family metallo-hydrolase [Acidobacteria bacterium]|nr:M20/M25/M40 family metallo-hydrolase [Acidobacteriota bacterium]MBV9069856.1 M20/M25/M40 family metallo-hydrolase [Acidobacteriota bacterium]MBV9187644.1 M20/M25/M40 family metallo-hydrolase [Acidobacteriota bacterium]